MTHEFFSNPEISKFRADEEDVNAYIQLIINKTDKSEILTWISHLSEDDLHSLIIPYIAEKMTVELTEKEL
jgi:hypothetical protein